MKSKLFAVALVLAVSAPAMAACTSTFELGVLGTPSGSLLFNSFGSVQHFNDCYNFTLDGSADAEGMVLGLDASPRQRDIHLGSISLSGGSLSSSLIDPTVTTFSFNDLLAGAYQLVISGDVTGRNGGVFGGGFVGYGGALVVAASSVVAPVPEPKTYALLALGLIAMGWVVRRRNEG
jgi:hypothetical protein